MVLSHVAIVHSEKVFHRFCCSNILDDDRLLKAPRGYSRLNSFIALLLCDAVTDCFLLLRDFRKHVVQRKRKGLRCTSLDITTFLVIARWGGGFGMRVFVLERLGGESADAGNSFRYRRGISS